MGADFVFGGLVAIVAQAMFLFVFLNFPDVHSSMRYYSRIFFAEVVKLVFSALGFIAIFKIAAPENPVLVFSGFVTFYAAQLGGVFFLGQSGFISGEQEP